MQISSACRLMVYELNRRDDSEWSLWGHDVMVGHGQKVWLYQHLDGDREQVEGNKWKVIEAAWNRIECIFDKRIQIQTPLFFQSLCDTEFWHGLLLHRSYPSDDPHDSSDDQNLFEWRYVVLNHEIARETAWLSLPLSGVVLCREKIATWARGRCDKKYS